MKKLTESFNEVTITRNEVFQIELPAMASAGYLWSVEVTQGAGRLLTERTVAPKTMSVGGPISQVFSFVAEKKGDIAIRAVYQRPWEDKATDNKTFTVTVK